jgi:hypothetical protein
MKFKDIISEQRIQEAPMGLLKTVGNKALSKVSAKAAGKLETGTTANQLYSDFKKYLGKTGQEPSREVVLSFLQSKGLPTAGAEAAIDKAGEPSAVGIAAKAAAGDAVDAVSGAAKSAVNTVKSAAASGANKLKQAFAKKPAAGQAEPTQRQDPAMADPAVSNPNFAQGNYQQGNYSSSAGFDKTTMKNVSNPMPAGTVGGVPTGKSNLPQPTTATTPATPPVKGRGGRKAGQLSTTPRAVARRQATAVKKAANTAGRPNTSNALGQFVNTQTGKNPISMNRKESIEYNFDMLVEALEISQLLYEAPLSRGQIEKAFMAAVQDSVKVGGGGQQSAAQQGGSSGQQSAAQQGGSSGGSNDGQQGGNDSGQQSAAQQGGGGFFAGLMGKGDGKVKGNFNVNQLAQILQVDPKELSAAIVKLKQGQPLSRTHITTLSNAFIGLYKADPQSTVQAANMLKKVSAA